MALLARAVLLATAVVALGGAACAENAITVEQKECPLSVVSYQARFVEERDSPYDRHPDTISHALKYRNATDKEIVAIRFGLIAFNVFNEMINKFSGYASASSVKPAKDGEAKFDDAPYAAFEFRKYGTGVVYVDAVRFVDGTIWRANEDEVLSGLRKVNEAMQKSDLREKPDKK